MRDALSIMDQAIASAPAENGRPVLSAAQIRDLMGSVPNTVFEQLMESVASGQTTPPMEQLNSLLNAGHSPLSLARQLVRYLRNALMAKLGGEQTELLQISSDERARAARTALLFTEEELTRNLQIVLHTFDDLNYRHEQRLHLELGLLKLIHAQRLLPVEELLSGLAAGGASSAGGMHRPASAGAIPARPQAGATAKLSPVANPPASNTAPAMKVASTPSAAGLEQTPTQSMAAVEHAPVTTEFSNGAAIQAGIRTESAASADPASAPLPGQAADSESLRSAIAAALA